MLIAAPLICINVCACLNVRASLVKYWKLSIIIGEPRQRFRHKEVQQ